jgi:N-acetylglucosaminyldiphosphoundecaprenol N-acetyl-beta-D-mannosaminyltransferase
MVIPDGSGVVLASKILKTPLKQKVGGFELGRNNIIPYLDEIGGTLFLLGSEEEFVEKAAANLNEKYKNLKVFYHHGYFDKNNPADNQKIIEKINASNADVVFVCFGGPASEKWIYEIKSQINKGLFMALGGTIDIIAGVKKYAPKIFIKLHLEWLYYFIKYPSRRKRFMKLPKFVFGTMFAKKNKKK